MGSDTSVLVFTYADERYAMFAVPFVYFALKNNSAAIVEIALESESRFYARYGRAVDYLSGIFGGRFLFRQSKSYKKNGKAIIPNTVRFVEVPESKAEYLYIGDIDLLIVDDVVAVHRKLMKENSLPFSNILRKRKSVDALPRLSGLHFCYFDDYYPLPDLSDLDLCKTNDEHVLYQIMERQNIMVPESFDKRPTCGVHMSLSRDPSGRCTGPNAPIFDSQVVMGWGSQIYYGRLLNQMREPEYANLQGHMSLEFRLFQLIFEAIATNNQAALERAAMSYLVDRRLFSTRQKMKRRDLVREVESLRQEGRFDVARDLASKCVMLWPLDEKNWELLRDVASENGDDWVIKAAQRQIDKNKN